jgi:hypothetical protein
MTWVGISGIVTARKRWVEATPHHSKMQKSPEFIEASALHVQAA